MKVKVINIVEGEKIILPNKGFVVLSQQGSEKSLNEAILKDFIDKETQVYVPLVSTHDNSLETPFKAILNSSFYLPMISTQFAEWDPSVLKKGFDIVPYGLVINCEKLSEEQRVLDQEEYPNLFYLKFLAQDGLRVKLIPKILFSIVESEFSEENKENRKKEFEKLKETLK